VLTKRETGPLQGKETGREDKRRRRKRKGEGSKGRVSVKP